MYKIKYFLSETPYSSIIIKYKYYKKIKVIARALPKDKARVAKILEQNNLVVGMTGDGVNDAPA